MGWIGAGMLVGLLLAERAEGAEPPERVEYAGCKAVWLEEQPRCAFDPDEDLLLWVTVLDPAEVSLRVDGRPWTAEDFHRDEFDGFGLRVRLPVDAERLELELSTTETWSLPLVSIDRSGAGPDEGVKTSADLDRGIRTAFGAAFDGDYAAALGILDEMDMLARRYPKGRADHATYAGMVLWWQGRFHDAATSLRDGVVFATKFEDPELQRDALPMYAATLVELGYFEAATEWSDRALALAHEDPELFLCGEQAKLLSTLAWVELSRSLIDGEPPTRAQALLEEALGMVGAGGWCPEPESVPGIELSLALVNLHQRDPAAALARLAEVSLDDATIDQRLRLLDAEVIALMELGAGSKTVEASLERLAAAADRAGTPEGQWRLALRRGDMMMRRRQLAEAVEAYRNAEQHAHRLTELAAVGVGRETAATLHAESTESLVVALVTSGQPEAAFCAAREAQARRTQAVHGGEDDPTKRAALLEAATSYASHRQRLALHSAKGAKGSRKHRERLMFEVARGERALAEMADQLLRERSTWRPKCEQLPPRAEGELLLGLYAMRRGWFVFAQDERGTAVRWLAGGPSHELANPALGRELLEPLRERLERASKVKVVASGVAQSVDVHLLDWNGALLVEHVPVVYGAELPHRGARAEARDELQALVVTDPTETLRMAGPEGVVVGLGLALQGWAVDAPAPAEATLERVLEGLRAASFFYYAGHAAHDVEPAGWGLLPPYAGGTRAWPAHMRLVPPATLEMQDILMLEPVPRHVALIGCQTGVPAHLGGGMSLALAFLVAGSEEVVATPVQTEDEVGLATGVRLLEGISRDGVSLAEALQQAQAELARDGQEMGRYRVWVP